MKAVKITVQAMGENKTNNLETEGYVIRHVHELIPGDIILHPIYRGDGLMLINRYVTLTIPVIARIKVHLKSEIKVVILSSQTTIERFVNHKFYENKAFIKILKDIAKDMEKILKISIPIRSFVDERVNLKALDREIEIEKNLQNLKSYEEENMLVRLLTSCPMWPIFELKLESETLRIRAKNIKEKLKNKIYVDNSLLELVKKMSDYDNLLVIHGINTASISILIGLTLELTDDEIIDLAISSLFCNIGFIKIDNDIFHKYVLNKEEDFLVNEHIKNSLECITTCPLCRNKSIIYGILDHHEHFNGSGSPNGKKGNEISLFGRIIAISSSYDDIVSGYLGNKGMIADEAINTMFENREGRFDDLILKTFIHRSNFYKIGLPFFASRRGNAVIIGFTNYIEAPHKPIVKFENGEIVDYYTQSKKTN